MEELTIDYLKNTIAQSEVIYSRGEHIYSLGNYTLIEADPRTETFIYAFDGSHGDYKVTIAPTPGKFSGVCTCPFPHRGCKHIVAAYMDIMQRQKRKALFQAGKGRPEEFLTPQEIKEIALEGRRERAKKEKFHLLPGDTFKGPHIVQNTRNAEYTVTIYNTEARSGHCTCPDYATNHLETCKHLIFVYASLLKKKDFAEEAAKETFPFVHLTWNSRLEKPVCYYEQVENADLHATLQGMFNEKGVYMKTGIMPLYKLYQSGGEDTDTLLFDDYLLKRMEDFLYEKEVSLIQKKFKPDFSFLRTTLYPYQQEGVLFSVFKKAAIIADEMGLGKTLQAISIAIIKRDIFGFNKVLIITPSSLKSQWKLEIEKFTEEKALIIHGAREKRKQAYREENVFFKIVNYETLLRDLPFVSDWNPDFIILDEAQRIKNFETKTHRAILSVPHQHSLVITGTPLENKLEDVYSIVQFSDPTLLTPLWAFAVNHFNLDKNKKNKVLGYKNLDVVHEKLKKLVIRRRKEDVLDNLPDKIENNFFIDLAREQEEIHAGYAQSLFAVINKKVLTPIDIKRMQQILLSMRMVCDSTYLIDKKTNISPKLVELSGILKDMVLANRRKVIVFSEWTTMTRLIGKVLFDLGIEFVEFSGKVPVDKRQNLIDEFRENPRCMVFLSTDAGGVGLNLQNTDCLINVELPWNPAKLNQRIGRIHRIGQKASKINVINLIAKNSIEERVFAGINLKQELFDAVLEGEADTVDMSGENKNKFVNRIRAMFDEGILEPEDNAGDAVDAEDQITTFLNPEAAGERETEIDVGSEEFEENVDEITEKSATTGVLEQERAVQLEAVLNNGLAFLNSLAHMATGKPMLAESGGKSITIDKKTGEIVMRFKL